jgi:hypothetical protein
MTDIVIDLPQEILDWLEAESAASGLSVEAIIRAIIIKWSSRL